MVGDLELETTGCHSRVEGWRPIETAPADVEVLLFEPKSTAYASLGLDHQRSDHGGGIYTGIKDDEWWSYSFMGEKDTRDDYFGDFVNPTHWMPLPTAPSPAPTERLTQDEQ